MSEKAVALITIHGMGKGKPKYYKDIEKKLKKKLGQTWSQVSFQNIYYADELQVPQNELWTSIKAHEDNDIDATKLRQFFIFSFGDAVTLEYSGHKDKVKYLAVQKRIQQALENAYMDLGRDLSKPVVIIAHSLGCQVLSNYLWDAGKWQNIFAQDRADPDLNQFLKLRSLTNLVTTGCNMPLFVSGLDQRVSFKKPNNQFQWDNFYDPDDVLGWPLRQLGPTFEYIKDHHINAGGLFTSWNPLSHGEYWKDKDVVRPLVKILKNHLELTG